MTLQKLKPLRKNFLLLCLVAFGSGAVVMSMELIVSRILTPVFGSSTYTWGSLIGIVLAEFNPKMKVYVDGDDNEYLISELLSHSFKEIS